MDVVPEGRSTLIFSSAIYMYGYRTFDLKLCFNSDALPNFLHYSTYNKLIGNIGRRRKIVKNQVSGDWDHVADHEEVECFRSICSNSADKPFSMLSMSFSDSPSQLASPLEHTCTRTTQSHNYIELS